MKCGSCAKRWKFATVPIADCSKSKQCGKAGKVQGQVGKSRIRRNAVEVLGRSQGIIGRGGGGGCGESQLESENFIVIRVYFKRRGYPRSNEISAKMGNVGPLQYTLIAIQQFCGRFLIHEASNYSLVKAQWYSRRECGRRRAQQSSSSFVELVATSVKEWENRAKCIHMCSTDLATNLGFAHPPSYFVSQPFGLGKSPDWLVRIAAHLHAM